MSFSFYSYVNQLRMKPEKRNQQKMCVELFLCCCVLGASGAAQLNTHRIGLFVSHFYAERSLCVRRMATGDSITASVVTGNA